MSVFVMILLALSVIVCLLFLFYKKGGNATMKIESPEFSNGTFIGTTEIDKFKVESSDGSEIQVEICRMYSGLKITIDKAPENDVKVNGRTIRHSVILFRGDILQVGNKEWEIA